jgi:hypothetical protein
MSEEQRLGILEKRREDENLVVERTEKRTK